MVADQVRVGFVEIPKAPLEGDGLAGVPGVGQSPVPLSMTVFKFSSGSLEGIFELLEKNPIDVGANRYVTVQVSSGAIVCSEQLSDTLLNGGDGSVIVPITRFALPSFFTVML